MFKIVCHKDTNYHNDLFCIKTLNTKTNLNNYCLYIFFFISMT